MKTNTSGTTDSSLSAISSTTKRWSGSVIFWVKLSIILLVLGWIAFRLVESWKEISQYHWNLQYGWIILSGIFYLTAFLPAATLWYLSLHWMGQKPTYFSAIKAFYASQLGKYIPGKAMVVLIRVGMLAEENIRASIAAVAAFYETLTMMATGAFLSALVIVIYFREHWIYSLMAFGAMLLVGLPVLPPIFIRIIHFLRIGKNDPTLDEHLRQITWRSIGVGFGLMTILWIMFGMGLWAAILGLGIVPGDLLEHIPRYVSVTALAIVLGFAVPLSPGGIGVREVILSLLLVPYFATILAMPENNTIQVGVENLALIVSIEQRMISIVAELAIVALFFTTSFLRKITQH